ncbi:receptor-type tyrosine-protein phosphatase S-like [Gigantopelta aegis]|uniref:receptor-type tyrosine-protein phosphatase S-like n=1 Tax=Gigantopelta aegis TaxID=1735272 RepID=UPI001B88818B|nr:receptor-type tyrosine-protein phosphatase S-like [Gigantopelta aegis]
MYKGMNYSDTVILEDDDNRIILKSFGNYENDYINASPIDLSVDGLNESHELSQYHMTSWPDHGVPEYVSPLLRLHKRATKNWNISKGPILVHCSAGVGRTALEQASKERVVDIAGIINRLREQRMQMVQTVDQYAFVHDAVLERVICGETEIPTDKYQSELQKLKEHDPRTHQTGLESQVNLFLK